MMKKTLILIILFVWSIGNIAQTVTQQLVVWQKSGEKVYFDLAEEPRTTFENGLLVITTNSVQTSYQRSNIVRYTFEGVEKQAVWLPLITGVHLNVAVPV